MSSKSKAPATDTEPPPQLPTELYRVIIEYLLVDRHTLRCLALGSTAWCAESQRALFRGFSTPPESRQRCLSHIRTHILFLSAILHSPDRLALYVETYQQRGLAHPSIGLDVTVDPRVPSAAFALWHLTSRTLPMMLNLKHLAIIPMRSAQRTEPHDLHMLECRFKLESFVWGFSPHHDRRNVDPFLKFLRTQHDLTHLELGGSPQTEDLSWLPVDTCPNVVSTWCHANCAVDILTRRRKIVALAVNRLTSPLMVSPSFGGLRYLKTPEFPSTHELNTCLNAVQVLELTFWSMNTFQFVPSLSQLRVLALVRDGIIGSYHGPGDVKGEYNLRIQAAIESFRKFPQLEFVVIEDARWNEDDPRRFRKMTLVGPGAGPDSEPGIHSEEFHADFGRPWWTVYGV